MSTIKVDSIKSSDGNTDLLTLSNGSVSGVNFGRRNLIINGAMQVAQRGTSETGVTTTDGYYVCDRWRTQTDTGTWDISQSTDAPDGFSSSLKINCTAAGVDNADEVSFTQRIEGQNVQHLAYGTSSAKQITVSFWVKTNKTGTFSVSLNNSDAAKNVAASFTVSSADTWEYKTATFDGDTAAGFDNDNTRSLDLYIHFGATTAYQSASYDDNWAAFNSSTWLPQITGIGGSTDDYVNITGVQLEVGSVATPFEHRSYGEELALCQRYYVEWKDDGDQQGSFNTTCTANDTVSGYKDLPVWMRIPPTVTSTSLQHSVGGLTNGLRSVNSTGSEIDQIFVRVTWSHAEANSHTGILYTLDGGYVRADAEL